LRIVGPPSRKAAHFHARHEQPRLMQRAAICCEQMRLSLEPRSSQLSLPARHSSYGKTRPPILEFLAQMIEVRRMHFSGSGAPATAAATSKSSMSTSRGRPRTRAAGVPNATRPGTECNEIAAAHEMPGSGERAPQRPRRGAECVRRFTISSCR